MPLRGLRHTECACYFTAKSRGANFTCHGDCMCPTRIRSKLQPIELDLSPALFFEHGLGRADLLQFGPRLEQARANVLAATAQTESSIVDWPQRVLKDYRAHRKSSLLGNILTTARRLRETVDRVVVIGSPQMITVAHALLTAGGHPYHNELSRGQRGERPRIYLLPAVADNDAVQGLLDILPQGRLLRSLEERRGLVALDWQSDEGDESPQLTLGLFHLFWDVLQKTTTATEESNLAAVVGPKNSPLHALAESLDICANRHGRQSSPSCLSAYRLPPAAYLRLLPPRHPANRFAHGHRCGESPDRHRGDDRSVRNQRGRRQSSAGSCRTCAICLRSGEGLIEPLSHHQLPRWSRLAICFRATADQRKHCLSSVCPRVFAPIGCALQCRLVASVTIRKSELSAVCPISLSKRPKECATPGRRRGDRRRLFDCRRWMSCRWGS